MLLWRRRFDLHGSQSDCLTALRDDSDGYCNGDQNSDCYRKLNDLVKLLTYFNIKFASESQVSTAVVSEGETVVITSMIPITAPTVFTSVPELIRAGTLPLALPFSYEL
jgi:hypothetical protein